MIDGRINPRQSSLRFIVDYSSANANIGVSGKPHSNKKCSVMKNTRSASYALAVGIIISMIFYACKKDDLVNEDPGTNTGKAALADTLSAHLLFTKAKKKPGNSPVGINSGLLRYSIKDTLRFTTSLPVPLQFLHMDSMNNISGAWVQIKAGASSGFSSFHFEVNELKNAAESDTVSVIMIGMEPEGLELPQIFEVKITPFDKDKKPLGEDIIPAKIDLPKIDLPGSSAACDIIAALNENWEWQASYTLPENDEYSFYNHPGLAHSNKGVDIEGSCCNGESRWPAFCIGEIKHNRKLHFNTYYTIVSEGFFLLKNGTFFRTSWEDSPVPLPASSDFCSNGNGLVQQSPKYSRYAGEWEITPVNLPPNIPAHLKHCKQQLKMKGTSTGGTGFGNPGGILVNMDCSSGTLILAQTSGESGANPLMKFYVSRSSIGPRWKPFGS